MTGPDYCMALRQMIDTELEAMTFYEHAAQQLLDPAAQFHLQMLAEEELEHARRFYDLYPDNDLPSLDQLASLARARNLPEFKGQLADLDERGALQLALEMERQVEANLQHLFERFSGTQARAVIRSNVESTRCHALLIAEDLERLTDLLPETEP